MLDNLLTEAQLQQQQAQQRRKQWCNLGRLPFDVNQIRLKFWFHILLMVTASFQLFVDNKESEYLLSSRRNWLHFFYPDGYEINPTDDSPTGTHYLYTHSELVDAIKHALESYETIVEDSLDALTYQIPDLDLEEAKGPYAEEDDDDDDPPPPALLVIRKYASSTVFDKKSKWLDDSTIVQSEYLVNSTNFLDTGAFDSKRDTRRITSIRLTFQLVSTELINLRKACLVWKIDLLFDFQFRGQISLSLDDQVWRDCDDTTSGSDITSVDDLLWLNILLLILCFSYFIVTCVEVEESKLFSMWRISEVVCMACLTMSSALNLHNNSARKPTEFFHSSIISLGQGLLWVNLIQYFSLNQNVLVLTLERTIPKVLKFLLEITPIFCGYAVFGLSFFSHLTTRFSSLRNAFATLFSLVNGDAIEETFQNLMQLSSGVSQIYVYTFVMVGSYVILNIVIALVEEAYFAAKEVHYKRQKELGSCSDEDEGGGDEHRPYQGRFGVAARRARMRNAAAEEREEEVF